MDLMHLSMSVMTIPPWMKITGLHTRFPRQRIAGRRKMSLCDDWIKFIILHISCMSCNVWGIKDQSPVGLEWMIRVFRYQIGCFRGKWSTFIYENQAERKMWWNSITPSSLSKDGFNGKGYNNREREFCLEKALRAELRPCGTRILHFRTLRITQFSFFLKSLHYFVIFGSQT